MIRLVLANGHVHTGFDERDDDDLIAAVLDPDCTIEGLPDDWTWAAGLSFRRDQLVAVENVREPLDNPAVPV